MSDEKPASLESIEKLKEHVTGTYTATKPPPWMKEFVARKIYGHDLVDMWIRQGTMKRD